MGRGFLSCVLVATLVIAVCLQQTSAQSPCCWFSKFEAIIHQRLATYDPQSNYGSEADIENTIHTDYERKIVATDVAWKNESTTLDFKVIEDYQKKVSYMIMGNQCYKIPQNGELAENCIPEDAAYMGSQSYIGIKADMWYVITSSAIGATASRVTVSKNKCVPMYQVTVNFCVNPDQQCLMNLLNIQNFTEGIKDPSVFNIPDYCPQAGIQEVPDMAIPSQLHHFSRTAL